MDLGHGIHGSRLLKNPIWNGDPISTFQQVQEMHASMLLDGIVVWVQEHLLTTSPSLRFSSSVLSSYPLL